jgi:Ca-activated chloride channel homolog
MEANPEVLTKAECFDTTRVISPAPLPAAAVVRKALGLYQTALRKPSATAYVLDFSGSMQGEREAHLKEAMRLLLDQDAASRLLLQASVDDVHIVIPFDDKIRAIWTVKGNDPAVLTELLGRIEAQHPGGGTDIYSAVAQGMRRLGELPNLREYFPAVILLTDGESNQGPGPSVVAAAQRRLSQQGLSIPVFALAFGEADFKQLNALTDSAAGRVFDSRKDLSQAFRDAKGYN